jgi:soluble lytic murein transglycosylase
MKTKRLILGLWLAIALTACNVPASTDTPTGTLNQSPSETSTVPTSSLIPSTSTPAPTTIPTISIASGDQALFNGDYARAREEYRAAYAASGTAQVRAAALWGMGRVEYETGNYAQSLQALRQLIYYYSDSPSASSAYFLLGETMMGLDRYNEAATYFSLYLSIRPSVIDAYVQERIGDAQAAAGNYPAAVSAYQAALDALHLGNSTLVRIKLARTIAKTGDTAAALTMYDEITSQSGNDYVKAQMDLLAGQLQFSVGETDAAYTHYQHAVENYPVAYDSYTALVALVEADMPVDDFQRGLVDYYAGKYGFALEAFDRYIASHPQNDGTVDYYRALTLQAQGDYEKAISGWTNFIDSHSDNRHWLDAWEDKAYTQWNYLGLYDAAAQTLLNYVSSVPTSTSAPTELLQAGRIQERGGKLSSAAQTWKRIADEYPNSSLVPQALFWAGIAHYRLGNYEDALVTFQRSLLFSTLPEDQARAHFWEGKTQQTIGASDLAQEVWKQAAALDPTGYYSERARDYLFNRSVFDPPPAYNLNFDLIAEQQEAESWIRLTFNLPADTDLSRIGALGSDPRLIRGTELWRLGMFDEARLEFEDLRQAVSQDPADSYRLANYMLDLGLYRSAIVTARQVLTLAGMDTNAKAITAPAYFNHVRYGPYYQDLIIPAAQENGLDPLFLFAVVRQESAFEGFVRSDAGARGLMQIMPDTGQNIVSSYGWPPNYTSDDLYRPVVSIQLGSHLLMTNRKYFNGDLYDTLASYNAGIGSAIIWNDLSNGDPDLFAEIVRFEQTRSYIRGIYENFIMYRSLYGTIP